MRGDHDRDASSCARRTTAVVAPFLTAGCSGLPSSTVYMALDRHGLWRLDPTFVRRLHADRLAATALTKGPVASSRAGSSCASSARSRSSRELGSNGRSQVCHGRTRREAADRARRMLIDGRRPAANRCRREIRCVQREVQCIARRQVQRGTRLAAPRPARSKGRGLEGMSIMRNYGSLLIELKAYDDALRLEALDNAARSSARRTTCQRQPGVQSMGKQEELELRRSMAAMKIAKDSAERRSMACSPSASRRPALQRADSLDLGGGRASVAESMEMYLASTARAAIRARARSRSPTPPRCRTGRGRERRQGSARAPSRR